MLWREIARLPRAQRDALLLREIRGLSYDQLADDMALSGASVRSLLNRARQRLRRRLEHIRTTLGAVSGLDALARLIAGSLGSSPAIPAATKAVALGLGAIAVTGGAAVTPDVLEHFRARQVTAHVAFQSPTRPPKDHEVVIHSDTVASVPIARLDLRPRARSADSQRSTPATQAGSDIAKDGEPGDGGGVEDTGTAAVTPPPSSGDVSDHPNTSVEQGSATQESGGGSGPTDLSSNVWDIANGQSGGSSRSTSGESSSQNAGDEGDSGSAVVGDVLSSTGSSDSGGERSDGGGSSDPGGSGR